MARKLIRKLRHWKQQFDPQAAFVWRKDVQWGDTQCYAGEVISDEILQEMGKTKLRRLWESRVIELAEFDNLDRWPAQTEDTAIPPPAADVGAGEPSPSRSADGDGYLGQSDPLPDNVSVSESGVGWYTVAAGEDVWKVRGRAALDALLEELRGRPDPAA